MMKHYYYKRKTLPEYRVSDIKNIATGTESGEIASPGPRARNLAGRNIENPFCKVRETAQLTTRVEVANEHVTNLLRLT
jgi:hypothetical protein